MLINDEWDKWYETSGYDKSGYNLKMVVQTHRNSKKVVVNCGKMRFGNYGDGRPLVVRLKNGSLHIVYHAHGLRDLAPFPN